MDVLILGAGGMAGHLAAVYFGERGHNVTGLARSSLPYCETIVGTALDQRFLKQALTSKPYDAIVNCIGVLNKDVDLDLSAGIYLNSYLPHFVVDCLKDKPGKFIHLSTDCVFSGYAGGYRETDERDSHTFYGKTKALGEINESRHVTLRTSIIGPDKNKNGIGLMNWFLMQKGPINGYTSAIWTGVTTLTLAQAVEQAILEDLNGLYHLVNNEKINKYDLLKLFNELLRKEPIEIIPSDSLRVDKSLINSRQDFGFIIPSYEQMIKEIKLWIDAHSELYPHYA